MLKAFSRPLSRSTSLATYGSLIILTLLVLVQLARSLTIVSLEMDASTTGTMKIQWQSKGGTYSEFKSKKIRVNSGHQAYFFMLWDLAEVNKITLNPIDTPAAISVKNMVIRTLGYDPVVYDTDKHFQGFKPNPYLSDFKVTHNQLNMRTLNNHAQFEFEVIHAQSNTKNSFLIDQFSSPYLAILAALLITLGFTYEVLLPLGLGLAVIIGIICFSPLTANEAVIKINMQSPVNNTLKVYWSDQQQGYTEQRARQVETQADTHSYRLGLGNLKAIQRVRVDPLATTGKVLINKIEILALGYDPIVLNAENQFYAIDFSKNKNLILTSEALEFSADTDDAFFEIGLNANVTHTIGLYYCLLALLTFMTLIFYWVKLSYPALYSPIKIINFRVSLFVLVIMLAQLFLPVEQAIYFKLFNINVIFLAIGLGFIIGFFYSSAQAYLLYFVVLMALFYNTQLKTQHSTITLELQSPINSELVVYWASKFAAYQENKSARINTRSGKNLLRLNLDSLNDIYNIRIDPLATPGQVLIKTITLSELGYVPIDLNADNHFYASDFLHNRSLKIIDNSLTFNADNADAFFEIHLNKDTFKPINAINFYLGFLYLLAAINLYGSFLKKRYPKSAHNINTISLKIGGIIIAVMLLQWIFLAHYACFIDDQAHKLVITTAGENTQYSDANIADPASIIPVVKLSLLNLVYVFIVFSTFLILCVFYKRQHAVYFGGFLLLCGLIGYAIHNQNTLIHIEMDSSIENSLKVYWADEAEIYKERHSASVNTQKGKHRYTLAIANLNNVHNIRIEPLNEQGRADISKIEINEAGYLPISLDAQNNFYAVDRIIKSKATNKETTGRLGFEQDNLVFTATDEDTFFELIVEPDAFKSNYPINFYLKFILLLGGVFTCLEIANRKFATFQQDSVVITLRICLLVVTVMIMQMAWLSDYDMHPDEKAHIDSIDYYTQYWYPPKIGDQRSLNTYQYPWGVSRLDDLGISYLLMGKLKNAITYFAEDTVFTCRVFNSLLILYLLFATRHKRFALFLIPLLCLPQVWHLFSYANRDGFALWLAILLGWQIANEGSYLQQYLNAKTSANPWRKLIVPTLLLGLLSIELTNYIIFILYFVTILIWQGIFISPQPKLFLIRCLVLVLLAGSFYGVRKAADISLNGFNKQEQKLAYAEAIAATDFKPSVAVTDEGYFGLRLQQKGVDALTLFAPRWEWQVLTFKSFTGLYGNEFAEYSPEWYYTCVAYLFSLIAIVLVVAGIASGGMKTGTLTAITVIFIGGDLLMGFLYSWLYDFQPQGRYIFPLIPMLMVYAYKMTPQWGNKVKALLLSGALILFVLGLFSFRFIALKYLIS